MTTHLRRPALALAGWLLLTACGGSSPDATTPTTSATSPTHTAPTTTAPPEPVVARSYSTVVQLRDAAIDAGLPCPHWEQKNFVTLASESGTCSDNDVLSTYATPGDLQEALDAFQSVSGLPGLHSVILVGPNWIINSHMAPRLARTLGGTVNRS